MGLDERNRIGRAAERARRRSRASLKVLLPTAAALGAGAAVAIGQIHGSDTRVILFVKLKSGEDLTADLQDRIRSEIKKHASPRHVPARIVQVPDIPRTKNGKVVEEGPADDIFKSPKADYTKALLAAAFELTVVHGTATAT